MVQHVERPCAEPLHDQLRRPGPDALHHAGGQVALYPFLCLGQDLLKALHLQLQAVPAPDPLPHKLRFHRFCVWQAGACSREPYAFPFIVGVPRPFQHLCALRVVHEDAEAVVLIPEYLLYEPASHFFSPRAFCVFSSSQSYSSRSWLEVRAAVPFCRKR